MFDLYYANIVRLLTLETEIYSQTVHVYYFSLWKQANWFRNGV